MQAQRGDEQADAGLQSMAATVNDHGPGSLNRNDEDPSIVVVRQNVASCNSANERRRKARMLSGTTKGPWRAPLK